MKKVLLGGALAVVMFGGTAFAGGEGLSQKDCPQSGDQQAMSDVQCPDQNLGTGGSGSESMDTGVDASDVGSSDMGSSDQSLSNDAYGGSGMDQSAQQPTNETNVIVQPPAEQPAYTAAPAPAEEEDKKITKDADMRGLSVTLGGGVEGYTGDLAPQINPGPAWGVGLGLRPSRNLGVELGYSGAVNSIDTFGSQNVTEGDADIIRNGGSAVATLGLSSAAVQPYLLGGIGVDRYNVRNNDTGQFRDDTVGNVPVGLGLRTQVSNFTADLRGTYGVLFDQNFAPGEGNTRLSDIGDETPTGRFGAQLRLGSTF